MITPFIGRTFGISASLIEYAKGYPVFSSEVIRAKWFSLEDKFFLSCLNLSKYFDATFINEYLSLLHQLRLLSRHNRNERLFWKHKLRTQAEGNDVIISAHTHQPCRFQNWYFNSGSWTDTDNNFIRILPDGTIDIFNWLTDRPQKNNNIVLSDFSNYGTPSFCMN
jgi:hypothetical protein